MIRRTSSATCKSEVGGLVELAELIRLRARDVDIYRAIAVADLTRRLIMQSVFLRRKDGDPVEPAVARKGKISSVGDAL